MIQCKSAFMLLRVNCHENIFFLFAVKNAEKPPVLKSVAPKEDESPKSVSPVSVNKEDSIKTAKTQEKRKSSQKRKASNQ